MLIVNACNGVAPKACPIPLFDKIHRLYFLNKWREENKYTAGNTGCLCSALYNTKSFS